MIGFAVFLRFDEIAMAVSKSLMYTSSKTILWNYSLTDQYRGGAWVTIAHSGFTTCPVGMLEC